MADAVWYLGWPLDVRGVWDPHPYGQGNGAYYPPGLAGDAQPPPGQVGDGVYFVGTRAGETLTARVNVASSRPSGGFIQLEITNAINGLLVIRYELVHLDPNRLLVAGGDIIPSGKQLGYVGAGPYLNWTGPHIHIDIMDTGFVKWDRRSHAVGLLLGPDYVMQGIV